MLVNYNVHTNLGYICKSNIISEYLNILANKCLWFMFWISFNFCGNCSKINTHPDIFRKFSITSLIYLTDTPAQV